MFGVTVPAVDEHLLLNTGLNVLPVTATGLRLQVPEPSMLALLAIALAALTIIMRRQGRG